MAFLNSTPRRPLLLAAGLLAVGTVLPAQTPDLGERAIKAAFLYNFTKFVDWPPSAFESRASPFRVCAFVDAPVRRDVEEMLTGESVGERPLRVVTPENADARGCHIAYFGRSTGDRTAQILATVRQAPVLTVGEGERFLEQGGLITFVLAENRVRFDVNKAAVDRAGLTMSSKLLRVARNVEPGGPRR